MGENNQQRLTSLRSLTTSGRKGIYIMILMSLGILMRCSFHSKGPYGWRSTGLSGSLMFWRDVVGNKVGQSFSWWKENICKPVRCCTSPSTTIYMSLKTVVDGAWTSSGSFTSSLVHLEADIEPLLRVVRGARN